ncbi:flavonol reductase [Coniella lustricola]|uniref:Flavonol reductase n=1 Tax=Coniella lustricola TaxID=2025994 RepID=A0A2T3A478_9PEZI|nr:flavonol reductase [Coniella lustricola]
MNTVKATIQKVEDKLSKSDGTSKQIILVTGATSYIGTHVIKDFLAKGYHVRGQVRNDSSAVKVHRVFPDAVASGTLRTVSVPDITVEGAFDKAVEGVAGVVHCASPFVMQVENNERDLLDPAVKGTNRILEAVAAHAPQVKRIVITSSFASIVDPAQGARPGYTYTEEDWNPTTWDDAVSTESGAVAYCASKVFAEKAAWAFVKEKQPNFTVATVCPPMVYGPVEHDADIKKLNTSVADIYRFMDGSTKEPGETGFPAFADVRDVAEAHLRAYERAEPGRYFITSGSFEYRDVCKVLRDVLPDRADKIPDPEATPAAQFYKTDNSRSAKELGMTFHTLHESIRDTALSLVALEQGKTWAEVNKSA